jgi:hypothetical protein
LDVTEPAERRASWREQPPEQSVEEILAVARPLPSGDEMVIEDLTAEEERRFFEADREVR